MVRPTHTIETSAAISRIAAVLAPLLTNRDIDGVGGATGWEPFGSNKVAKIASMLEGGLERVVRKKASPSVLENAISTMTLEAYRRYVAKQVEMTHGHVDEIIKNMRVMGLDASDLAKRGWRRDLLVESSGAKQRPTEPTTAQQVRLPVAYPEIVSEVSALAAGASELSPQQRGKRLEAILHLVLDNECLRPRGPMRNPGEEVDRSFVIDGQHYLLESKWEHEPVGFPEVRDFIGKVQRKAEGTFGVFFSMSGFVGNVNSSAIFGQRLNCVGLTGAQFMNVIEGRVMWRELVERARRAASDHGEFEARTRRADES